MRRGRDRIDNAVRITWIEVHVSKIGAGEMRKRIEAAGIGLEFGKSRRCSANG